MMVYLFFFEEKLKKIVESYKENNILRELIEFLLPFGITTKQVIRLYNEIGVHSINQLKENPYKLFGIYGVTIEVIDIIAKRLEYPMDSRERLIAHVKHVLFQNEEDGNTGMEAEQFGLELLRSLKTFCYTKENICNYTISLIKTGILSYKKIVSNNKLQTIIFRTSVYKTESIVAEKIIKLVVTKFLLILAIEANKTIIKNSKIIRFKITNNILINKQKIHVSI